MKAIFAIDAFAQDDEIQKRVVSQVQSLITQAEIEVEPVYVFHSDASRVASGLEPQEDDFWVSKAQELLKKQFQSWNGGYLVKSSVLRVVEPSKTASVKELNQYAKKQKKDLIIVGTHGRAGVPRLFMGSFSECLLLHSEIPVLVISPHSVSTGTFKNILFPTDFSKHSTEYFHAVLKLATQVQAKVIIYNVVHFRKMVPMEIEGISTEAPSPELVQKIKDDGKKNADSLIAEAKKAGITAEFVIEVTEKHVDSAILTVAENLKVDLIVMAAQSGMISANMIGSLTRHVVRAATCPVWVLRHHN